MFQVLLNQATCLLLDHLTPTVYFVFYSSLLWLCVLTCVVLSIWSDFFKKKVAPSLLAQTQISVIPTAFSNHINFPYCCLSSENVYCCFPCRVSHSMTVVVLLEFTVRVHTYWHINLDNILQ